MDDALSLRTLQHSRVISGVDRHLAELVARLSKETLGEAKLAMALASQWPQRGHVCLDLHTLEPEDLWETVEYAADPGALSLSLPAQEPWLDILEASPAIGAPEDATPFVLWQRRWLYLRRYWDYERALALRVRAWCEQSPDADADASATRARAFTATLFETATVDERDLQQQAVLRAASSPCLLLSGGPGTGKTSTVVRILALLLSEDSSMEIALAAPTGKAALRLQESIAHSLESLPCNAALKCKLPRTAQTLHRLLGYQRNKTTFRHDRSNPLPHDLVVVDEASMLDLGLLAKLLQALRPQARLLLVGDSHQLPSVDAGAAFGALCSRRSPLPQVELKKNYRFSQDSGIGALAQAIREGRSEDTEGLLTDDADVSCQLEPLPAADQLRPALWKTLADFLKGLGALHEPAAAFAHLDTLRLLCAHRLGPFGSTALNELIQGLLAKHLRLDREQRWYPGRPILITENDYAVELFNGDTGIILPWQGKLHAFFRTTGGEFRHFPPARLPAHESAYAMTVHKSQGSEFDRVLLILTDQPTRLLTRELLYTAVTRARSQVTIWSPPISLHACVERPLRRTSGLEHWFESWENAEPTP